jgi:hypothetical protein
MKSLLPIILLLLTGCSTAPERVTFADIVSNNQQLLAKPIQRDEINIEADCDPDGSEGVIMCTLPQSNLEALVNTISLQRDDIEAGARAHNQVVGALNNLQFAYSVQEQTLHMTEKAHRRDSIISGVKQALTTGALIFCAVQ